MELQPDLPTGEPLSEATFLLLLALTPAPNHGYGLIKQVQQLSDGQIILSTGTLYGAIRRLLDLGWIERQGADSPDDTTRTAKTYALTELGRRALAAETARLRGLVRLAERYGAEVR